MYKTRKNGFTLVELLAVIVILAVILVIAVPSITSTIIESRKGALESSAKLIASSVENAMIANQALGVEKTITCADVSNYNQEDYECSIKVLGNKPYVSLIGKGKFEGQSICYASKEGGLKVQGSVCPPLAIEKIESLFTTSATANGLEKDDFENVRYTGASPKNFIKFNNEDWRIIGLFEVKTVSGSTEKLLKIVRDSSIGGYAWDVGDSGVNNGNGINQWGASTYEDGSAYAGSDLMVRLNNSYLNRTGDFGDAKTVNGIDSTSRNMIESVVWNTGAFSWGIITVKTAYNTERGTTTDKHNCSGANCNDTVKRTTTWIGKVGLIYPSDYGYASTNADCREWIKATDTDKKYCTNDNWLHNGTNYWTLSPLANSSSATSAWLVCSTGYVDASYAYYGNGVRPSVYLKSNVVITGGNGESKTAAYQLSM